jgi:hypothetical protein
MLLISLRVWPPGSPPEDETHSWLELVSQVGFGKGTALQAAERVPNVYAAVEERPFSGPRKSHQFNAASALVVVVHGRNGLFPQPL